MDRRRNALAGARGCVAVAVASCALVASGLGGADASTAASAAPADGVTALVVDPASGCPPDNAWVDLNQDWASYGSVQVSITSICGGFTLDDLEMSGADTVILDGTAFAFTVTSEETRAILAYAEEGHTVLGVGPVFKWDQEHLNNGLAPILGFAKQRPWRQHKFFGSISYNRMRTNDPDAAALFRDLPTYATGLAVCQKPSTVTWVQSNLDGARYLGWSGSRRSRQQAITVYDASSYTAIYISTWASGNSSPDDLQFLYNAVIYPNVG